MHNMNHFKIYCDIITSPSVVNRALKVSFIVGTLLNIINQGEVIISLNLENLHIVKFILTYFVPYIVTTYTATAMKIEFQIGTKATVTADLKCRGCGAEIHVEKGELIPECPTCGIYTKWRLK